MDVGVKPQVEAKTLNYAERPGVQVVDRLEVVVMFEPSPEALVDTLAQGAQHLGQQFAVVAQSNGKRAGKRKRDVPVR
jgi:hypothetical protein